MMIELGGSSSTGRQPGTPQTWSFAVLGQRREIPPLVPVYHLAQGFRGQHLDCVPHVYRCQIISRCPEEVKRTVRLPSSSSVIACVGWNRKSRAVGAAAGEERQTTSPYSLSA